jgi:hypothetical protein
MSGVQSFQVYVTFSGEASKGGSTPIDKVMAFGVSTDYTTGTPLGPVTGTLKEPRGMALDTQHRLYVAQADKSDTTILVYGPIDATYPMTGTTLIAAAANAPSSPPPLGSAALLHPYGLALDAWGNLFQSSQDTNVVSAYQLTTDANGTLVATNMPTAQALLDISGGTFYSGQYVMTFVELPVNKGITLVPQSQGGLDYVDKTSAHSVRGIVISYQTLYVVDEAASQVGMYDAGSGTFTGWITTNGTSLPPMEEPVGIAADPFGMVYIGASKSSAIYKWTPQGGGLSGVLSQLVTDATLADVSGLAVLPDNSILYGSRSPVTAPGSGSAVKSATTYSIYRYDGTKITTWVSGLTDTPECLLLVPMPPSA